MKGLASVWRRNRVSYTAQAEPDSVQSAALLPVELDLDVSVESMPRSAIAIQNGFSSTWFSSFTTASAAYLSRAPPSFFAVLLFLVYSPKLVQAQKVVLGQFSLNLSFILAHSV